MNRLSLLLRQDPADPGTPLSNLTEDHYVFLPSFDFEVELDPFRPYPPEGRSLRIDVALLIQGFHCYQV